VELETPPKGGRKEKMEKMRHEALLPQDLQLANSGLRQDKHIVSAHTQAPDSRRRTENMLYSHE
jgi:hypothetical protein